ncbi:MAG: SDR family NAD(P)-dependent oxidoreductase [Pseudomonadota bacterium]
MSNNIVLLTGITSGLGYEAMVKLLRNPTVSIITGVRNSNKPNNLKRLRTDRLTVLPLDLSSLQSVSEFCGAVETHLGDHRLSAMGFNAGTQITTGLTHSVDGIETTFAVNYLSHYLIGERLSSKCAPSAPIVVTASGTHDPGDPIATRVGFRGGVFRTAKDVASGKMDADTSPSQQCLDRYATSKMANIMHVLFKARTDPDRTWIAYDPGLMPGTALARDRSAFEQFAWTRLMPALRHVMRGVSSAEQSGATLANLLLGQNTYPSGSYVEFTGRTLTPWKQTTSESLQEDLINESQALIERHVRSRP